MSKSGTFTVRWEVEDGYVGKSRPHQAEVDECEIEDDFGDREIEDLFDEVVEQAFQSEVSAAGRNFGEFKEWAEGVIASRGKEPG